MALTEKRRAARLKINNLNTLLKYGNLDNETRVRYNVELRQLTDFIAFTNPEIGDTWE